MTAGRVCAEVVAIKKLPPNIDWVLFEVIDNGAMGEYLYYIRENQTPVFAFKRMTGCVPDYLTSKLVTRDQVSGHVTLNSQRLNIPLFKTSAGIFNRN